MSNLLCMGRDQELCLASIQAHCETIKIGDKSLLEISEE
jgi:hypothetical protein